CRSALPGLARFVLGASAQMDTLVTGRFPQSLPHLARLPLLSSSRSAPEGVRVIDRSSAVDLRLATKQSARLGEGGDLFEVFDHGDGYISTVVADVCGNGGAA